MFAVKAFFGKNRGCFRDPIDPRLNSKVHHLAPVGVSPSEAADSICCGGSARGVFGAEGEARSLSLAH